MGKKKPIISPFGQWAYPGEVTIIPSSDITMKGVNYPVLGIDDLGNQQMMMPGQDYTFPGNYVTEYPQMGKGGQMIKRKDGSYSQRGLWDNIRANKGSGKKPTKQMLEQERKIKAKMKNGGWLDQYQDGSEVPSNIERMDPVNIKIKRKNVSDSPKYQYDNKGNLLYTPDLNIYPYLSDNSSRDSFWVTPKIPIQNLNPTVEELRTVAAPYYPIDNKLVSDPKLTFKYSEAKPSNYQESLEQEYVLPQVIGKSFGNLPLVKDDGYSPNRRWITSLRNGDKLSTGYRYNSGLYAYGPNNYAYVLKTDPNNLVNYATKDKIENDLSLNDKALYDYLAKINYSPDNVYGLTRKLPDQIWNRAEQMRVEMRNNPEIMSWANLHNVDLGYKERYEDNEDNDDYAPKIPESIYAARLAKAGLPTNRPDYDYGDFETYIAQDPSKFNLVDYFPVDSFLKNAQNNPNNEKDEWGEVKDDQALKKQMAKRMGIDPSAFDSGEYLIHYNKTPITEYTPGKKYGGWLEEHQRGGTLPPIYTSNPNDPRIRSYRDSLSLYNKTQDIKNPKYYEKGKEPSWYSWKGDVNSVESFIKKNNMNYSSGKFPGKIQPVKTGYFGEGLNYPIYKKPVQPIIYKKPEVIPEVVETPVVPVPVVEPPKPSLVVSNIDRDMYTPGGGMGREYNIGITLQDGSKKAFRTEKEYQDWKAANNLDISNAKVTEGKGYSYDYPENKKYGGWLDQFQTGSEVPSDIERMDPAVIKRDRSWLDKLKGYIHRGEKAIGLDPYNERPDDFMEQWARRINTATGGKDWYKQPNDASGAGGIGTAVMETVMAPFSAPQLASVYGATGKVQMPSEAMNIQNPVGSFLADAILDPTNLVGAGIAKNLGKGSLQNMVRSRMRGARPDLQRYVDNVSNELPAPPSELRLNESTGQLDPYYNTERPYFDQWMRTLNATSNSQDVADLFANPSGSIDLRKLKKNVKNKSGLTKEEILKNASLKDKEALSKMSESEFEETVLKPTGEIVRYNPGYDNDTIRGMYFWAPTRQNQLANASQLSYDEYANIFNSKLDVLNDIIAKNNKSGLEYKVKQLSPSGNLTFHTPSQIEKLPPNSDMLNTLRDRGFIDPAGNIDPRFQDYADRWGINGNRNIPEGESTWRLNINPGQWRGDVEDIPYAEYYKAIPGLNMKDTTASVFSDAMPRRGTGAYESINEYLKLMDLGRVKPGFNLQTQYSSGLWQDAIKKGKAYGYFHNPTTIYGSMKTVAPLAVGAAAASQLQEQKQGGQTNWLNKYK